MYKDRTKQKEAMREAVQRHRKKGKGITSGITKEEGITSGITSLNTPQDVRAVLTEALGKWHPVDQWTAEELAAHRQRIVKAWSRPGDYNRAYRIMIGQEPGLGWDQASRERMARLRQEQAVRPPRWAFGGVDG